MLNEKSLVLFSVIMLKMPNNNLSCILVFLFSNAPNIKIPHQKYIFKIFSVDSSIYLDKKKSLIIF